MIDNEYADGLAPVVTIDGPSGTGKGTIARIIADRLAWHLLDSGALYRLLALAVISHTVDFEDINTITTMAEHLDCEFKPSGDMNMDTDIFLEGEEVSKAIRTEEMGNYASIVAAIPSVREALKSRQRAFRQQSGLVADGRDMGTVIFPDASLKIYLTASAEERAKRRYKQLKEKGLNVNIPALSREIAERDNRDTSRAVAPLKPAEDAVIIDTSAMTIDEVAQQISSLLEARALV
jgi:cytidylate kinase